MESSLSSPYHTFPARMAETTEPQYQKGDKVEYRPVGGAQDNVSHSFGEIVNVHGSGQDLRYAIKNANTGKTTSYQEKNIVGKRES